MNKIQYLLLKINEECVEIATALVEVGASALTNKNNIDKLKEVNLEINDLNALIEKLKIDFNFEIPIFHSIIHLQFKEMHDAEDIDFWHSYTVQKALAVSKIASKCIQFGLNEVNPEIKQSNSNRLLNALRDLYFAVDCLNEYSNLGYKIDNEHISDKLEKIEKYLQLSIELNCVNSSQPPKDQLPIHFEVFVDEYSVYQPSFKEQSQTVIALPHKL